MKTHTRCVFSKYFSSLPFFSLLSTLLRRPLMTSRLRLLQKNPPLLLLGPGRMLGRTYVMMSSCFLSLFISEQTKSQIQLYHKIVSKESNYFQRRPEYGIFGKKGCVRGRDDKWGKRGRDVTCPRNHILNKKTGRCEKVCDTMFFSKIITENSRSRSRSTSLPSVWPGAWGPRLRSPSSLRIAVLLQPEGHKFGMNTIFFLIKYYVSSIQNNRPSTVPNELQMKFETFFG